ncbi:MAG: hypothetical protein JO263_03945, partial [Candidatus Eremiobacteraeota bacterium]|nr:hypothetical protein [Candidatus Eremiobacteraeota bacterium]
MNRDVRRLATLVALMAAFWVGAWSTAAAADGWAWDSVTKVMLNGDAASLQPGSFDDDYARAAAVKPPPESGGGIFGKMNQAMAMAAHFQDLMQNGFAEKHYVAGSKERTDQVADRTATIVDCAARTITTLDLQKKTYRVVSMDQPSTPSSGGQSKGSGSSGTDSNDRVAIVIANKSLGARSLGGQA